LVSVSGVSGSAYDDLLVARPHGHSGLFGEGGDDTLRGGSADDTIFGNGGRDTARGFAGADYIIGGVGRDTIRGGSGNDFCDGEDVQGCEH
jgi:Ca2+-binding RTX toxin-like protein